MFLTHNGGEGGQKLSERICLFQEPSALVHLEAVLRRGGPAERQVLPDGGREAVRARVHPAAEPENLRQEMTLET